MATKNHGRPAGKNRIAALVPTERTFVRTRDKCAILGFTQHNYEAPWGDAGWDFKGLNDLHSVVKTFWPADKGDPFASGQFAWYQLHWRQANGEYPGARDPEHTKWLQTQTDCPIWMWEHDPTVPASLTYPLQEVLERPMLSNGLPLSPEAYFNNSISWMIAHAIVQGYKTIGLFGIDMAMDGVHNESEYGHQRPSVEYFVGIARGLGIEVIMPQQSELLKCAYLYGYENKMHLRQKLLVRLEELEISEAQAVDQYEASKRAMFQLRGAMQVISGTGLAEVIQEVQKVIPPEIAQAAAQGLANDEALAVADNENAKRSLHEVRGAKHNTKWMLRNYFPGEGPRQDVYRGEGSVISPVSPMQSDGHGPVNRIALLAPLAPVGAAVVREE